MIDHGPRCTSRAMRLVMLLTILSLLPHQPASGQTETVGPALGHIDETSARVWLRAPAPGAYTLHVSRDDWHTTVDAVADVRNDLCVVWHVDGLQPATDYRYEVLSGETVVVSGPSLMFRTAPPRDAPGRTTLAFGSCASSEASSVWTAMELRGAEGLVLLGDTPYIDTRDLDDARSKHRRFLLVPELARLARSTPIWATWDDHDFGGNDVDGRMDGKTRTRQAFVEYRALANFGENDQGIYTSFRHGAIEVFLIDARWFARTERGAGNDDRWTLLGEAQWAWIEAGLKKSTAPFKVLATGMIWDDKENSESDDWGSYPHERERLERFLGQHDISGVVLMGGDIHCSRHLSYPESSERVGYVLDQVIVSPLHERTIASLNVDHPDLMWSAVEPRVFLTLTADTTGSESSLTARWIQDTGVGAGQELHRVRWTRGQLTRPGP